MMEFGLRIARMVAAFDSLEEEIETSADQIIFAPIEDNN